MTVYFKPMAVYYPLGSKPYILQRPYIFKDRIFYFAGPKISLPYKKKYSYKESKNQPVLFDSPIDSERNARRMSILDDTG